MIAPVVTRGRGESTRRGARALIALCVALMLGGCAREVPEYVRLEVSLARARAAMNHRRAIELSRRLVVLAREFPPVDSTRLLRSYDLLQQSLVAAGQYPQAIGYQDHLVGLIDGMSRPDSAMLRRVLHEFAECALRVGRTDQAMALLTRAASLHGLSHYADAESAAVTYAALARLQALRGQYHLAVEFQRIALDARARAPDSTRLEPETLLVDYADYLDRQGPILDAARPLGGPESLYVSALKSGAAKYGENHPMLAPLYFAYGDYLHEHGRHDEAVPLLAHGVRLAPASPDYDPAEQAEQLQKLAVSSARVGRARR